MPESTAAQAMQEYLLASKNSHNYNRRDFHTGHFQNWLSTAEIKTRGRMPLRTQKGHAPAKVYRFRDNSILVIPTTTRENPIPYVATTTFQKLAAQKVLEDTKRTSPMKRDITVAMVRTAAALDRLRRHTGHTAVQVLDIACSPYHNRQTEFREEVQPGHPFGDLLREAFAPKESYDPEKDPDGEWWHDNVAAKFGQRYMFW